MPTTTLRVPDELKKRIARVAEQSGTSAHALMLDAIEERVRMEEARAAKLAHATERFSEWQRTGRAIDWQEMRAYLKDRTAGRKAKAPRARAWRR
jgi:predicted transcriptional regulator